jgi:hypothetical protein
VLRGEPSTLRPFDALSLAQGGRAELAHGGLPLKNCLAEPELAVVSFSQPHGGRSSMVEPRIVVPDVAGSNPVGHPSRLLVPQRENQRALSSHQSSRRNETNWPRLEDG